MIKMKRESSCGSCMRFGHGDVLAALSRFCTVGAAAAAVPEEAAETGVGVPTERLKAMEY